MALFHIARYRGPEAAEADADADADADVGAQGRARALLERLQSRARERQCREAPQTPDPPSTEAAGRRRRRPRRSRGRGAAGSPEAPPGKRLRVDGGAAGPESSEEARGAGAVRGASPGEGPETPGEEPETPGEEPETPGEGPETPGEGPETPGEAPGSPRRSLVLGGFRRIRAPKPQPFLPAWLAEPRCVERSVAAGLAPLDAVPELHPELRRRLRAQGVVSFFPVQAAVIPAVLRGAAGGFLAGTGGVLPRDLCVSAPTGSGKTLAFVIPVVQALLHRVVCRVRALVVLPTKELAQQVSKVFNVYTDATPLRAALVTGQKSLAKEQESLVQKTPDGFRCLADIVVATPGRLVDHIDQTPGFSLRHLRFLVIDEADRMVDSMHQSWLPRVVAAAFPEAASDHGPPGLLRRGLPRAPTAASICWPQMPLQKLLFSATLTQNPEKLQRLGLYRPWLFSAAPGPGVDTDEDGAGAGKFAFPAGLMHHYVPCRLRDKPLVLLHLLNQAPDARVLCFTNSRENAHRLFLLVQAFGGVTAAEFSSRYGPGRRKATLREFEQGRTRLLISTDATARGIDVQSVQLVVNYDAPQYLRTYVHRVGRTARAGRSGHAFTLLLKVQERRFLHMLAEAGLPELQRQEVREELLRQLEPRYEEALAQLEQAVKEERAQKAA
ncbi:ATP-dependent RNA helicase DDX51 isoform X2 [Erinaceus europaeus]|uniref:ATP-dependent RNA helicase n=1 Tax=Erinaceus europaeus TaxID=9365 RepID=A0ABM3XIN9_ERIEU|nr:ATP-dependent RNA helicase DDX51 isoform X2 [Erinaceus europaeus]